jgi:acetyl-CoA synthase
MSKPICTDAIVGAREVVARARQMLADAIAAKGDGCPVGFPSTAYYLPVIYSMTGMRVEQLGDLRAILDQCDRLLPEPPSEKVWLPYLGDALDAGMATLFAFETIEACKTVIGPHPVQGIWLGAANDVIMRERGIEFVDGTAPGFAAVVGAAPDNATAVKIATQLQQKNLYVFMAGSVNGTTFAEQLDAEGVQLGWETRLVPFGRDVSAAIYALGFANRAALSFGGVAPGDFVRNLRYNKNRIFAFVLALGTVDREKYAAAAGAINYGFPTIADTDIPQILPTGVCTYEHVVSNVPHDAIVDRALEVRGCKVKVAAVPIPVPYGPAFEGERIRANDAHVEFGGNRSMAFEFVTMAEMDDIVDGQIDLIGPDVDAEDTQTRGNGDTEKRGHGDAETRGRGDAETWGGGDAETPKDGDSAIQNPKSKIQNPSGPKVMPLAIWVEVAGRKMQPDFEPILERQIHHLVNGAEGIWHMGQRDIVWTRISKKAFAKGLRLRHYGEILHAQFLDKYPAIVDKVQVTLITDPAEVERRVAIARKVYIERNKRLASMTDESVEIFYSCLLCQSFAPNHVCIITPERLGLCGAYNWLDGKAAYEIDETGPNQPVAKGYCLDAERGIWEGINQYVLKNSHGTVSTVSTYSMMDRPMTSCGCFEAIVAYVPECNGVMIVNREYTGDTPVGMSFSTLAGSVGGGQQTPGFIGIGKAFITSRKFLAADGGLPRVVWMPAELKRVIGEDLAQRASELGMPGLLEQIADETIATEAHQLRAHLEKIGHPALKMPEMGAGKSDAETHRPGDAGTRGRGDTETRGRGDAQAPEHGDSAIQNPKSKIQNPAAPGAIDPALVAALKAELKAEILREVVGEIIGTLQQRFLGGRTPSAAVSPAVVTDGAAEALAAAGHGAAAFTPRGLKAAARAAPARYAAEKLAKVTAFELPRERPIETIARVTLGATQEQGGTRGRTVAVGGQDCLPLHFFEGSVGRSSTSPDPTPVLALEVFDTVSPKCSPVLREVWGDLLARPADMARRAVQEYGADLISVRLDGTHPEKGGKSPDEALALVRSVLAAVDVPLMVTAHNHVETANEVLKKVAAGCAGERLLLNWVENENYRTIAGAALAYGHCVVAQSPIDVNLAKQLNILLGSMDLPRDRIIMDALTGALGYGLEYVYSVTERIRLTGLGGDKALAFPIIACVGQEAWKVKEASAPASAFPAWGDRARRAVLWEVQTAVPLVLAGADLVVLQHPESLAIVRRNVARLSEYARS